MRALCGVGCLLLSVGLHGQAAKAVAGPVVLADADKPRIYVTESDSWQVHGSGGGGGGGFGGFSSGGASPQTAEIVKTFGQRCPNVVVNNRLEMTDYVVTLQHEGGKGILRKKDKVAVFVRKTGDSIFSESTLSVGGSVQDACGAMMDHWTAHAKEIAAMASPSPTGQAPVGQATAGQAQMVAAVVAEKAKISVNSTPGGADIEINGEFVGNTPSVIEVGSGKNEVKVTKKGFAPWTRTLTVTGGTITLNAELESN
jgi:PEGA domain